MQSFLGSSTLSEINAEGEELDEDGLESAERGGSESLGGENFRNGGKGCERLVDGEEFIATLFERKS